MNIAAEQILSIFITFKRNTSTDKFPIVPASIWPIVLAVSTGATLFLSVLSIHNIDFHTYGIVGKYLPLGCWGHLISFSIWIINLGLEGRLGYHTVEAQKNLREGFKLFIVSELIFFASFFGSFIYGKYLPSREDRGQITVGPLLVPTINTAILVISGLFASWAHGVFTEKWKPKIGSSKLHVSVGLAISILLGLWFTKMQVEEYIHTTIKISDGIFGGIFYVATGFHGAHVIIGSIFLFVILCRSLLGYLVLEKGGVGFDCAVWYWHFVDVIWIILYGLIYIWGSAGV